MRLEIDPLGDLEVRVVAASARQRAIRLGESPAVPRISDLAHFHASAVGKLELDMMGSHQMSERQVIDAIVAEAIKIVFEEYPLFAGFGGRLRPGGGLPRPASACSGLAAGSSSRVPAGITRALPVLLSHGRDEPQRLQKQVA